jgi:hypothetical protein
MLANIPAMKVIAFKSIQHNLDLINEVDFTADFTGDVLKIYESYTDRKASEKYHPRILT